MKSATKLLAPLNESIRKLRQRDLIATLSTALDEFDGSNSATLMGPAMITGNLLLPEVATQLDQRRINRNLLECLLLEFDASFLAAAEKAGLFPEAKPSVVSGFKPAGGLPQISGVSQIDVLGHESGRV